MSPRRTIQTFDKNCLFTHPVAPVEINAYPNPSAQAFTVSIKFDKIENVSIDVFDMLGRKVYQEKGTSEKQYRFGQNFKPGTYFVKVEKAGVITTKKLIKM